MKGEVTRLPVLYDLEDVKGKVQINLPNSKPFEHKGIKIEIIGAIEGVKDKKDSLKFLNSSNELQNIGILTQPSTTFDFNFPSVKKPYETCRGNIKNVRYTIKVTIETKLRKLPTEIEFAVIKPEAPEVLQTNNQPIKLEVGIEDWLHLIFDVSSRNFGLKDIIQGQVEFKKVSIRMKSMEIQIIRKETVNTAGAAADTNVITRYEIMDGGPTKYEKIPIRFFLKPYGLTPTYMNINNRFSVQYFINLVLTDVEDRKYFKQHEIIMHRIDKKLAKAPTTTTDQVKNPMNMTPEMQQQMIMNSQMFMNMMQNQGQNPGNMQMTPEMQKMFMQFMQSQNQNQNTNNPQPPQNTGGETETETKLDG